MDPGGFLADLGQVPDSLARLAQALQAGDIALGAVPAAPAGVLFLGMGSSAYAAGVVADLKLILDAGLGFLPAKLRPGLERHGPG